MSTYTGVGSNVTQSTSPTETIPADGDSLGAASVTTALERLLDYIAFIFAGIFTGSGANPGLFGTGGATGPGIKAVPGGGATPARGAWSTPAQVTPSAPVDGDSWYDGAGYFARIVSTTKQFVMAVGGILARTQLPAVGKQLSASSGSFISTSASPTDVTNLSINITTSGRPVHLTLEPDGSTGSGGSAAASSTGHSGILQLLRGATVLGQWANISGGAISLSSFVDEPAAGTYTYKMQVISDGTGVISVLNWKLVAYEL